MSLSCEGSRGRRLPSPKPVVKKRWRRPTPARPAGAAARGDGILGATTLGDEPLVGVELWQGFPNQHSWGGYPMDQATFERRVESGTPIAVDDARRPRVAGDVSNGHRRHFLSRPAIPLFLRNGCPPSCQVPICASFLQELIDGSASSAVYWDALLEIARGRLRIEIPRLSGEPLGIVALARGESPQVDLWLRGTPAGLDYRCFG